ncbi:MAG: oligopeptidase B [Bacteroidetes bacterium MedPE-SWsnd-G2]|nr:MAG: oligopeptidase B [Bacteroidetes bacterium MedPE-SWsnd-G2]
MIDAVVAPKAKKIPKELKIHNDTRIDDYFWLNERENPEVINYLKDENEYFHKMTSHTNELEERLFEEIKARIKEDDQSVPYKYNGYWYLTRYEKGKDYPIYLRKKEHLEAKEEILFDCNEMAEGLGYFKLVGLNISPDNKLISYAVDTVGRRQYTLKIKNLESGVVFSEEITHTTGSASWANDNKTLFYTKKDEQTLRSDKVFKHSINTSSDQDTLIYHETDDTFNVALYKTKSRKYIVIACFSTLTNEYQILDADTPDASFKMFQSRIRGLEYSISHYQDHFYVITNKDDAFNFKLMKTSLSETKKEHWTEVIPHREDVLLEDIDIFKDYLVISERINGLNEIRIKRWDGTEEYFLPFDNETYTAYTSINVEFDTDVLRYGYNSMTTPSSVIDFNMSTRQKSIKKEQEVLGGQFNKNNYKSERVWATAQDGTKVPISLVYKKGLKLDGSNPLLQYAYGSYGSTIDPYFSSVRLSLLDRGFIYAIAHVRGGEYLGRQWYDNGRLYQKKNTFQDFIDCSKHLIEHNYTSSDHIYAMGGSAGGLLMGAIINMENKLYNGVISAVPFVDVVTTMLDDGIPLTTGEYDEWGNPHDKGYYDYIKSYSPYDNIEKKDYPNLMVTAGLHDSQVQYWEPAKWVAKLRDYKTNSNKLIFKINMEAGHGGASGRFEALKEDAEEYAFLLDLENIGV